ncbi:uncharacterized protein LOC131685986 isoform X3 [Topomyia yanbarensis]|uniref:uncharacterized protein LOC131685986 isoform X3 n=1 Tax=Topomyia yanbarensis TaxID=2498891 RepID=UPI00273CB8BE|nr:uncharacterized protein LOC131685986 isoform X3 [Topomyia yanbarensis]
MSDYYDVEYLQDEEELDQLDPRTTKAGAHKIKLKRSFEDQSIQFSIIEEEAEKFSPIPSRPPPLPTPKEKQSTTPSRPPPLPTPKDRLLVRAGPSKLPNLLPSEVESVAVRSRLHELGQYPMDSADHYRSSSDTDEASNHPTNIHLANKTKKNKDTLKAMFRVLNAVNTKLDATNISLEEIKRDIKEIKGENELKLKLQWPISNRRNFDFTEQSLRDQTGIERCLKNKLKMGNKTSVQAFIAVNIKNIFRNAGRFTWTGRPSNYPMQQGLVTSEAARSLQITRALIETTQEVFPYSNVAQIEVEIKKALNSLNDKRLNHSSRRMQRSPEAVV